jgi:hexosaminidase
MNRARAILLSAVCTAIFSSLSHASVTDLRARGYSLVPAPQKVELLPGEVTVDQSWSVNAADGVDSFTAQWLQKWLSDLHGMTLRGGGTGQVSLKVAPGTVKETGDPARDGQGYSLTISPEGIEITGNSQQGLFYGVCSLIQLLREGRAGGLRVPECRIVDWPDLDLRFVHKDTKMHQERPETIRRHLDWLALFKVNCVAFDLDDRYEYPSHPIIGIPGAYTKQEMQEFTRFALQRHIQFVPDMQSPAHFSYALKHPEFASLRADGNNYQACLCDDEAVQLILDMFQDLIDATPGVKYFHASMDEVYYAGICAKCKRPYNDENRSLAWVEYVQKVHQWLTGRGRTMLAWVEYPLLPRHVSLLPPDIINGVLGGNPEMIQAMNARGIRQLVYTPMQGEEMLFPNYFPTLYNGEPTGGRLSEAYRALQEAPGLSGNLAGCFAAFWDASGPHEETAWLGWATVIQYAWSRGTPSLEQHVQDFFDVFYGPSSPEMGEVYRMLLEQARFFESGWDRVVSEERGPSYGNSRGKGVGTARYDQKLSPPALPDRATLKIEPVFRTRYAKLIARAEALRERNELLTGRLIGLVPRVERNSYNVEVLLSIAEMEGYFIRTVLTLAQAEKELAAASAAHGKGDYALAVSSLSEADRLVRELIEGGDRMFAGFKRTWEKSDYAKGRSVGGRQFVFIQSDTKDLLADRRPGLEYVIAPFQRIKLPEWRAALDARIAVYAGAHGLKVTLPSLERQDN